MIKSAALGFLASLNVLGGETPTFFEESLTLPAGLSELTTDHAWNAVSFFSPEGQALPKIFYADQHGIFHPWHIIEENHQENASALDLLFAGAPQKTLLLRTDEKVDLVGHFFNTHIPGENFVAKFEPFDDDTLDDPSGNPRYVRRPRYIARSEWGADESLRVKRSFHKFFQKWFRTEADLVKPQYRPKLIRNKNANGEPLFWPISENPHIEKFIIHHTGEYVTEQRPPAEIMRAIYQFHTITRGWGDIGYNYVIDKQGNIYEGRAGGPKSVGGHTAYHNIGSIGVSLMGNFQREHPTEAQMNILALLLADHAVRFDVDPSGSSYFSSQRSQNITSHRDVARAGHGTACPGKHLHSQLSKLRIKVSQLTQELNRQDKNRSKLGKDFLKKSEGIKKYLKTQIIKDPSETKKKPSFEVAQVLKRQRISRRQKADFEVKIRNNTQSAWPARSVIEVLEKPDGLLTTPLRSTRSTLPGLTATFRGRMYAKDTPNGQYELRLKLNFLTKLTGETDEDFVMNYPLQISGDKRLKTKRSIKDLTKQATTSMIKPVTNIKTASSRFFEKSSAHKTDPKQGPHVKVKLAFFEERYADIQSSKALQILNEQDQVLGELPANKALRILSHKKNMDTWISFELGTKTLQAKRVKLRSLGILTIKNYSRKLGSNPYNQFRRQVNAHVDNTGQLVLVNELPIEEYLRGLSEEPSTEPTEKKHAIHVLARSYALVYSGKKRKFRTSLYDLEDDPRTSQFYLGYGWERYHADQIKLLKETQGQVITYQGIPVIGPYFTQSGGESSAKWSKAYPWTKSQKLPYDEGLDPRGHGVGLSGNTSRELAKKGQNYQEILDYFFENIKVQKAY